MSDIIIKEIRAGNRKAFKLFFESRYDSLVTYANGYLFDIAASEDVVQDIFVHIWENAGKISINTSIESYLKISVRNKCLNYLRACKVTDSLKVLEINARLFAEYDAWEDIQEEEQTIICNQLLKSIDTLPKRMQEVVKMRFMGEYSYKEIAEKLGISINTVKTQLKRARIRMTEVIAVLFILLNN